MDILIRLVVIIKKRMGGINLELNKRDMEVVTGGGISYSMINAFSKAINTIYELGKHTGSSIRRLIHGKYCPMN